ncbi:hypothetical protein EDB87DRAFT_1733414 [Lactarius vividus]|nr:hypothetical protein EDB87DRAFT_1733414 [Lactarius vividus]
MALSSADGQSTVNQTNLSIKGIIAIKAMSQMSSFVNKTTDFDKYSVYDGQNHPSLSELLGICVRQVPVNISASPSSAAFGAMYAPLALKFVYSFGIFFSQSNSQPHDKTNSQSHDDRDVTKITHQRGFSGYYTWRLEWHCGSSRDLWPLPWWSSADRDKDIDAPLLGLHLSKEVMYVSGNAGSTLIEAAPPGAGPQTDSQRWLVHPSSSLEDPPLLLRGMVSVPVADRGSAAATATSSSEARILQSEVNVLRHEVMHEIQRLTVISESPPSYTSSGAA